MSSKASRKRLVIYTVGMTPEPIVASLKALASSELVHGWRVDPSVTVEVDTDVVFIASPDSRTTFDLAKQAARSTGLCILNQSEPIVVDPFDFDNIRTVVLDELARVVPDITRYDEIVADLTGGTKAMAGALASVALDLLRPGSGQDVYLSYVQLEQDPQGGAARSLPPRLTRLELDDFILREVVTALEDGDVDKAFQAADFLSPSKPLHEWLKAFVRLQKSLSTFRTGDAQDSVAQLRKLSNTTLRSIEEDIDQIRDTRVREALGGLLRTSSVRSDCVAGLLSAYRHLQRAQSGNSESMQEAADWLAGNDLQARKVPLHFIAEAIVRRLRGDFPLTVVLLYRAIEAALQVVFVLRKQRSLWDFDAMRKDYPDVITDRSVPMSRLEEIMRRDYSDASKLLDGLGDTLKKLRGMRNYGVLAHGFNDSEQGDPRTLDRIVADVFRFVVDLCFRGRLQDAISILEYLTPFGLENEKWARERSNLLGPTA